MNESTAWPATPQDFSSPPAVLAQSPSAGGALNWRAALPSAAIAGVVSAILSLVKYVGIAFPIWMFSSGIMAVALYRRRMKLAWVPGAIGARLGAMAGGIAFAIFSVALSAAMLLVPSDTYKEMAHEIVARAMNSNPDPQVQHMLQWFLTPPGLDTLITMSLLFLFLGFLLLGTFGGALWAALTGRRPHET